MIDDHLVSRGIKDLRTLEAMSRVPRHLFVEDSLGHKAYGDHPLPIGDNQTISQPFIVAHMTQALQLTGEERVLEIGTGSGYQTAILAETASQVFTIERISSLSKRARILLGELGYTNVNFKVFDGAYGWRDQSPYQAILVAAAAPDIPSSLLDQLDEQGGRLVAPVGDLESQQLVLVTRRGDSFVRKNIGDCKFVPMIGKFGWTEEGEKA
ncbi:MAG: protein-L-isoaspartate(D-aspartate) O-methyltransferase [Candidatus Nitrohelix vancouverensis]|uniref:Protein-L-isoaspartate O-methyltransferase n=1 Tax=Candidatus Nitrohelix vancouverensis TaxID=2705534 RepID=A0A7T0G4Z2_9BACT|nr:MAG: protein-L-isoaspartate(D-aspartate) O-methyltransferase [Candidatus Nitrohelix vancouverensis]